MRFMVIAATTTAIAACPKWALAQTSSPSAGSATSGPVLEPSRAGLTLVTVAVVAIFLAWLVPLWVDARRAYKAQGVAWKAIGKLEEDAAKGKEGLEPDEVAALVRAATRPPEGIRGLARVLLAFLVLSIVAVITLALLFSSASGVFDVIKQIVTALLGVLATIIGFYFGARTAEGASAASPAPSPQGTPPSPFDGEGGGAAAPDEEKESAAPVPEAQMM